MQDSHRPQNQFGAHETAELLWPGYDLGTCLSSRGDCDGVDWLMGVIGVIPGGKGATLGAKGLLRGVRGAENVQGGIANVAQALNGAQKWLGNGYSEIAPGVFRSSDGARQFRMTDADLLDPKLGPHVHFEAVAPDGRTILENSHLLIRP